MEATASLYQTARHHIPRLGIAYSNRSEPFQIVHVSMFIKSFVIKQTKFGDVM